MEIAVYTLTSELHNKEFIESQTRVFLGALGLEFDYCGDDFSDYGTHLLDLIYVRTGGTEGLFKRLLPQLQKAQGHNIYLLASDKSNSLPAAMEILSYLIQKGLKGEILHGAPTLVADKIRRIARETLVQSRFSNCRLGLIGDPSDWLIASQPDEIFMAENLGVQLIRIPMKELLEEYEHVSETSCEFQSNIAVVQNAIPGAHRIYLALRCLVEKYELQGFTIRCFDLLGTVHNTGCLALARLNAEGLVAGCEGDVPAMLSMWVARSLFGISGFQSNPASINVTDGDICLAHCTIPFDMLQSFELDTHFESGIGVAVRGHVAEGPVTIFKMSGDGQDYFVAEGELLSNGRDPELCRTQLKIHLNEAHKAEYFLKRPIGNHHILIPGHHGDELESFMRAILK